MNPVASQYMHGSGSGHFRAHTRSSPWQTCIGTAPDPPQSGHGIRTSARTVPEEAAHLQLLIVSPQPTQANGPSGFSMFGILCPVKSGVVWYFGTLALESIASTRNTHCRRSVWGCVLMAELSIRAIHTEAHNHQFNRVLFHVVAPFRKSANKPPDLIAASVAKGHWPRWR